MNGTCNCKCHFQLHLLEHPEVVHLSHILAPGPAPDVPFCFFDRTVPDPRRRFLSPHDPCSPCSSTMPSLLSGEVTYQCILLQSASWVLARGSASSCCRIAPARRQCRRKGDALEILHGAVIRGKSEALWGCDRTPGHKRW